MCLEVLDKAQVTPDDQLIFLGDYVDGWSESPQTLDFLMQLERTHQCIFLKGNHDDLLWHWFNTSQANDKWLRHGGQSTLKAYAQVNEEQKANHKAFIKRMPTYHIDSQNRLFVHAGFANLHGPANEFYANTVYWDRTLWETAIATDKYMSPDDLYYPKRLKLFTEIYIGHTPTTQYGIHTPLQAQNVINLDTGAAYRGSLTIMNVDTKKIWQSRPVNELYPNELGRN